MTWLFIAILVVVAFLVAVFVLKVPAGGREAVAAALLLGVAGYVMQGSPRIPSRPSEAVDRSSQEAAFLVTARGKVTDRTIPPTNHYVIIADGFARNGQTAEAASVLQAAVEEDPKDSDAWVALANALVAHAEGALTPASLYAFHEAAEADPKAPGPEFFLGLAMAQSGKYAQAQKLWGDLLQRTPESVEWRPVLASELKRLDAFTKAQDQADGATPSPGQGDDPEPSSPVGD